jgi:MoaA/NifB/PqqE/SkfB family radical SAM enzyme
MNIESLLLKTKYLFHLLFAGRLIHRPYHCQFQITRRCNAKCIYCRAWSSRPLDELSLEEISVLSENLELAGVKSVVITGGEPLLRNDIVEAISIFKKNHLLVRLQTNGLLLDVRMASRLLGAGLDDLYVSLDTLQAERFRKFSGLRNSEAHKMILENIAHTSSLAKRYGAGMFLLTVLMPENSDEVDELVNFAQENGCLIGIYGVETSGNESPCEIRTEQDGLINEKADRIRLAEAFVRVREIGKKRNSPVFNSLRLIDDYIRYYSDDQPDMQWSCRAGEHYLVVLSDGRISVCNGTDPVVGFDYRNLAGLYRMSDRDHFFSKYRMCSSGCICTRQLEYILNEPGDIFRKALLYLRNTIFR